MKTYKNITESNNPISTDIDTLKIREILEILSKDSISILDGINNSIESIGYTDLDLTYRLGSDIIPT